ncbi:MAG: RluA family pseudouridine synthase [Bowdeniella nasicola]|nr:RluA family pseudouridine synthase [Bowdeniella nasicola]
MNPERRYLPVPDGLVGERVDRALARLLGLSRAQVGKLIADNQVRIDGELAKASMRLGAGAMLDVHIPGPKQPAPDIKVDGMRIIHDDPDIVVVDKPVWVAAHASRGWSGPHVVGSLRASGFRITGLGPVEREGIVHRLDVGTTGVMVVAKSDRAYSELKAAFRERRVTKRYLALAHGEFAHRVGTIEAPIGHAGGNAWKMAIRDDGKPAITHYRVQHTYPRASLVQVELETGRTHQIRVHCAAIGHPLLGDTLYGASADMANELGLTRQWLHASELHFIHPGTGMPVTYRAPIPADLQAALDHIASEGQNC